MKTSKLSLSLAVALAAMLSATPALAQGNGNGNRDKPKHERNDDRRWDDDRRDRDDRRYDDRDGRRRVPPGWCQGRGNPHNTVENCGRRRNHVYYDPRYHDDRYGRRDGRYDGRRYDDRYDRNGSRSGSYDARHYEFHRRHDYECRQRAAQRPLDLTYQVRVRRECAAVHTDWHRREGIAHR